jgi:D-mannonate dehydratase
MKIALSAGEDEAYLQYMRQLGVEYVVSGAGVGPSGALEAGQLKRRKDFYAQRGLIWDVIENLAPESTTR